VSRPRLSVVIPTYNRRDLLAKVLDSLDAVQAAPGELEVIVVDDGSTDGTEPMLAARHDPFPLRVLRQNSQGPSAARNRGAAEAQGEILGFIDSDVVVQPKWWRDAAPYFKDRRVAAVEGAVLLPPDSARPTPFTNYVLNDRGRAYLTCNFLCRRDVFLQLGGFEKRFCSRKHRGRVLHNREDTDLAFSLQEAGYKIVFESKAVVWHPLPAPSYEQHFRQARIAFYEALLRRRHPRLYREQLKWIDGRALPVFYWGFYLGLPLMFTAAFAHGFVLFGLGLLGFVASWVVSVYALCRKRRAGLGDLLRVGAQMLVVPWLRLYWVLRGEWKFRKIKPVAASEAK